MQKYFEQGLTIMGGARSGLVEVGGFGFSAQNDYTYFISFIDNKYSPIACAPYHV